MNHWMRLVLGVSVGVCVLAGLAGTAAKAFAADPTTSECLAASEASLTLRRQHKVRGARAQLLTCSAASCPADVRNECLRRLGDINAALPTIVFVAKDAAGNDLTAVKVTMDGHALAEQLEGAALPVDPGEHAFTFALAGRPPVEKKLVIHEGEKARREQIVFPAPVTSAVATSRPNVAPVLVSPNAPTSSEQSSSGMGTQRILGIVAAGLGVVGVGVGIGFGLDALSKHNDANKLCPESNCPTREGLDRWNQAHHAGHLSNVAFIVGGVGLAAGAVLWFTAPEAGDSAEKRTAQVGFGPGTLQLRGVW